MAPGFRNKQLMSVSVHSNVDGLSFSEPANLVTPLKLVRGTKVGECQKRRNCTSTLF